jgi:hypothetical protein
MKLDLLKVYSFDKKKRYGEDADGGLVVAELAGGYDCYVVAHSVQEKQKSFTEAFLKDAGLDPKDVHVLGGKADEFRAQLSALTKAHSNVMLNMDIEGGEYGWLLGFPIKQLCNIKQIAIEFHGITDDSCNCSNANKMKCLEKLSITHYLVHAHGNNYAPLCGNVPTVIELTYVNKKCFQGPPPLNARPLPIPGVDFRNSWCRDDYDLNFPPFVH